jgi:hypothetical protein
MKDSQVQKAMEDPSEIKLPRSGSNHFGGLLEAVEVGLRYDRKARLQRVDDIRRLIPRLAEVRKFVHVNGQYLANVRVIWPVLAL